MSLTPQQELELWKRRRPFLIPLAIVFEILIALVGAWTHNLNFLIIGLGMAGILWLTSWLIRLREQSDDQQT